MDQPLLDLKPAKQEPGPSELIFNVDGGSRGNPGPAGYGAIARDASGQTIVELSGFLGIATNNVAEYRGLLAALEYAREHAARTVKIYCDSELVVRQIQGIYKVKSPELKPIFDQVKRLAASFPKFSIHHVPRERNADADRLANLAMDRGRAGGAGEIRTSPAVPRQSAAKAGKPATATSSPPTAARGSATALKFVAVVEDGKLRPLTPAPELEEGQRYEVSVRKPVSEG